MILKVLWTHVHLKNRVYCASFTVAIVANKINLQNHWANFNQTWHKASLGEAVSKGPRPFPTEDNYEIVKIH